jgi:hypothetical protein
MVTFYMAGPRFELGVDFPGMSLPGKRLFRAPVSARARASQWVAAAILWGGCESAPERPSELLTGDAGSKPERDAGPPLDCKTSLPNQDADRDFYSPNEGDCNDCDPEVSPAAAFDVVGNAIDEDCDGADLLQAVTCDGELDPNSDSAEDAARTLGLCAFATQVGHEWGVRGAKWKLLDDGDELEDARQIWLTEAFGSVTPREGSKLFVMSTGVARDFDDPDYTPECDTFTSEGQGPQGFSKGVPPPNNYPRDSSQCPVGTMGSEDSLAFNDVGLELRIRVPSNARSLSFDSIFFTHEYPTFVCSRYNDFFVVFMTPRPNDIAGNEYDDDRNVVYDSRNDPVGVNTALLSSCRKSVLSAREIDCEQGPALLAGTGFDREESTCGVTSENADVGGASTGWLRTSVPVMPGEIVTLHFMLWDSGDPLLDSTVAIDHLQFGIAEQSRPSTGPITGAP